MIGIIGNDGTSKDNSTRPQVKLLVFVILIGGTSLILHYTNLHFLKVLDILAKTKGITYLCDLPFIMN